MNAIIDFPKRNRIYVSVGKWTGDHPHYPREPNKLYIMKMDTSGHLLSETVAGPNVPGNGKGMVATDDDNLIISGKTRGGWGHNNAVFSMKVDTAGNEIWHTFFGQSAYSTSLCNTIKLDNGTIVNVGSIVPVHMVTHYTLIGNSLGYINKVGADGQLIWEKQIDFQGVFNNFWDVTKGLNRDLILCGGTWESDSIGSRGWIVKINKNDEVQWSRKINHPSATAANRRQDYLYNVVALKDGSFVAAGSSDGKDALGRGTQDGWLIRFDSNGCIHPEHCKDLGVSDNFLVRNNLKIFPNPTSDVLNLSRDKPFPKESQVRLLDNQGRVLKALPDPAGRMKMSYHLKGLSPGMYYLEVTVKGYVQTQKVVLER